MLTWFVADLKTGAFVEELPLKATTLERTIGSKSTCLVTLDVTDPSCPPGWRDLLDGRRALIVPVDDDIPLAGYVVTDAEAGAATVPLTLATLEHIPDRVYVTDASFVTDVDDEADVAAALLSAKVTEGWGFGVQTTKTNTTGDHTYSAAEDRTVASALSDLMAQAGGPEWVTRIAWEDGTHRRFVKTIEIGPKVGRDMRSTVVENVHLESRRRARSWQKAAVRTIATGDGSGLSRLMSDTVVDDVAVAAGVPPWEIRVGITSADSDTVLNRVAVQAAASYRYGTQTWKLEIAQTTEGAPRLVRDYDIGDTVYLDLEPTRFDPAEIHGPARVIGWSAEVQGRSLTKVTPVFWEPDEAMVA